MFLFSSYWKKVLDLIFPITCVGCSRGEGQWLCQNCRGKIGMRPADAIDIGSPDLECVWAAMQYKQPILERLLHIYKYRYVEALGEELGIILAEYYQKSVHHFSDAIVLPMPMARKRLYWRGFNQAELIARSFVKKTGLSLAIDSIVYRRFRRPQVGLSAKQRALNVANVFSLPVDTVFRGRDVIIIDDVVTTGATLISCAKALKKAGAKRVYGLCVAVG